MRIINNYGFRVLLLMLGYIFFSRDSYAQVKFDSNDPYWLKNNGLQEVTIYETYKDALKDKKIAYKLSSINEVIGKDAPKLGKLANLQLLNLQNNEITSIPADWGLLTNMYIMVIKQNPIQFIDPKFLSQTQLLYLELFDTKLDSLPKEIERMDRLELLRIINNTTDTLHISDSIKRIPGLRDIFISYSNLFHFPSFICRSKYLESVSLINCKVDSIPPGILNLKKLKVLDLTGNNLKEVPLWIRDCTSLEVLVLKNNKIDNVSEWISSMPNLQFLDISNNQLSLPDLDIIRVLFRSRNAIVYSDFEKLLKERIGEQRLKQ